RPAARGEAHASARRERSGAAGTPVAHRGMRAARSLPGRGDRGHRPDPLRARRARAGAERPRGRLAAARTRVRGARLLQPAAALPHPAMNFEGIFAQLAAMALALVLAPLLVGWVNQCRARLQNRRPPPLLTPFRMLHKLFYKESVVAHGATQMYRLAPYLIFSC